nr:hypothetical protein [Tanacetum cinerariifolium]
MSASMKACIARHAAALTPSLPVPSPPLHLPSPLTTSPTDTGAPLSYRAAMIRMRALLPSTSHKTDIPEADVPPQKRVKESSKKGQNRIKTEQKWEAWGNREKFKAVTVDRGRKTEQNAKRMAVNASTVKKLFKVKRKKKREGPDLQFSQSHKKGANSVKRPNLYHKDHACNRLISLEGPKLCNPETRKEDGTNKNSP